MLPVEILTTLRYGEALAASVPASRAGWRAWVYVRPRFADSDTRTVFPLPMNDDTSVRFSARRVELSEWHLDERWYWDMDIAIRERPILDQTFECENEIELEKQLLAWSCKPASLKLPHHVGYPEPPPTTGGRIS